MSDRALDPDTLLVQAMADGDRRALGQLYDRHAGALRALAVRMLRDADAGHDLVHDVLLEAWRCAADFDPARGAVRTWLCLRLRSRALDRLRSARARREVLHAAPGDDRPARAGDAPDLAPDRRRVRAALGALPTAQRAVLELGYFEGLSSTEIADRLDVPVGTVKSRTRAGLEKLRGALGAEAS